MPCCVCMCVCGGGEVRGLGQGRQRGLGLRGATRVHVHGSAGRLLDKCANGKCTHGCMGEWVYGVSVCVLAWVYG